MRSLADATAAVVAARQLSIAAPEDVVAWAEVRITVDPDSERLTALASLRRDSTGTDVDAALRGLADEQGVAPASDAEAGRRVAADIARRVVAGTIEPIDGARRLRDLARAAPDVEPELRELAGLAGEWEDDPSHRRLYDDDIRASAAHWLDMSPPAGSTRPPAG